MIKRILPGHRRSSLVLALLACASSSCGPVLYTSVGQNVPLFREKGEVAFGGGYAETADASGITANVAAAAGNSIAVTALYHALSDTHGADADWNGRGTYFEAAVGRFGTGKESMLLWEVFGGLGHGTIKNTGLGQTVKANYLKPFIQPSVAIGTEVFELAVTPRIAVVNYLSHTNTLADAAAANVVEEFFDDKGTTLVFEPGATLRLGYRAVKAQVQYCYSTFSTSGPDWDPVNPEFLSLSLQFLISKRFTAK